jgi:hypothetical protein
MLKKPRSGREPRRTSGLQCNREMLLVQCIKAKQWKRSPIFEEVQLILIAFLAHGFHSKLDSLLLLLLAFCETLFFDSIFRLTAVNENAFITDTRGTRQKREEEKTRARRAPAHKSE